MGWALFTLPFTQSGYILHGIKTAINHIFMGFFIVLSVYFHHTFSIHLSKIFKDDEIKMLKPMARRTAWLSLRRR
jgi:hypothetical protein